MRRCLPALLALLAINHFAHAEAASRTLDDFTQPNAWQAIATDDIGVSLHPASGPHGKAI